MRMMGALSMYSLLRFPMSFRRKPALQRAERPSRGAAGMTGGIPLAPLRFAKGGFPHPSPLMPKGELKGV